MSLKAAEASSLLGFAIDEILRHGGATRFGEMLLGAGAALKHLVDELKAQDINPSTESFLRTVGFLNAHLKCAKAGRLKLAPKHHFLWHMIHRMLGATIHHQPNADPLPSHS
eukprot:955393-Pyramimonas_sp.AAC.1